MKTAQKGDYCIHFMYMYTTLTRLEVGGTIDCFNAERMTAGGSDVGGRGKQDNPQ